MNKYRSSTGKWLTKSLFTDYNSGGLFSMNDLRLIFLQTEDPTGYVLSTEHLGGWAHLTELLSCNWFEPQFRGWQDELYAKIKAEAVRAVRLIASDEGNRSQLPAARFLHELDKAPKETRRGRPSTAEIDAELDKQVQALKVLKEDQERIGLKLINGGKK